jgi:hypothetical protein
VNTAFEDFYFLSKYGIKLFIVMYWIECGISFIVMADPGANLLHTSRRSILLCPRGVTLPVRCGG